ncbi:hypothetical protein JB92DRAFT_3117762 [Gautieria morchelliformis]|nr:hypothetical protein JB92DRAFT_3117762 [Gautieria morchelliformis]
MALPTLEKVVDKGANGCEVGNETAGQDGVPAANDPSHPIHAIHRQRRTQYAELLQQTKRDHWVAWLEEMEEEGIWDRRGTGGEEEEARDNQRKSELLHEAFFLKPSEEAQVDPGHEYPPPAFTYEEVMDAQILQAIARLKPYKAPGPSGIPHVVLMKCSA